MGLPAIKFLNANSTAFKDLGRHAFLQGLVSRAVSTGAKGYTGVKKQSST